MKIYFTTKQVLLMSMLGGPLGGLWAIAENIKLNAGNTVYRYFLGAAVMATAIMLATLFSFSGGQPAPYWPLVFAFAIAVLGELLYGESIDKALLAGEATVQNTKRIIVIIGLSLLIQFIMLLVIVIALK